MKQRPNYVVFAMEFGHFHVEPIYFHSSCNVDKSAREAILQHIREASYKVLSNPHAPWMCKAAADRNSRFDVDVVSSCPPGQCELLELNKELPFPMRMDDVLESYWIQYDSETTYAEAGTVYLLCKV